LTLAAAWVAHHAGRWDDVRDLAASVAPEDALMEAEVVLLEAGRLIAVGDAAALAAARAGLALVPSDEPRGRTGLLLVQGRALLAQGDLDGAARSFAEAARLAEPWHVTIVLLIARSHLAEIHRRQARRAEAITEARAALELAARERLDEHPEATVANLTLAQLLIDERRGEEATVYFQRGADLAARVPYVPRQEQLRAVRERLDGVDRRGRTSTRGMVEQLTGRELSVLRLLPSTLTPREIAVELYLSLNTIKSHTRSIYRKLGVQSRHEAIEAARGFGLL
jgi:LuxR family maltose regulon positive regulatory protein